MLVAVPAYGASHLTDAVVGDLLRDSPDLVPRARIVVVDNAGDYAPASGDHRLTVHRPGHNLRWIGAANWALRSALEHDDDVCIVLNNDTRLSRDFVYWLATAFSDRPDAAVAAACYDDFWLHQRARAIPPDARSYDVMRSYRDVAFCDGTAIAFALPAVRRLGLLDEVAFPRQGYGADIDYALRARAAGYACVVTEAAYVHHLRRGTMRTLAHETGEHHRHEILTGLDSKWGPKWRERAGLAAAAFPADNVGSAADWYL